MPTRRRAQPVVAALTCAAAAACVAHPVGPARTYSKYEGKAVTTARSALSAVEMARMSADTRARDRSFGPYAASVIGDSEETAITVAGTFGSIQPPGPEADALRSELEDLLTDVADHLSALRIAARRGERAGLAGVAAPLTGDVDRLRAFVEAHR